MQGVRDNEDDICFMFLVSSSLRTARRADEKGAGRKSVCIPSSKHAHHQCSYGIPPSAFSPQFVSLLEFLSILLYISL